MNLLKYVEPMKNLPERFSNLAFWRGCRKFKDSVVNALEYIDSWGTHIESLLPSGNYVKSSVLELPSDSYDSSAFRHDVFTLSQTSSGLNTIMEVLSINLPHFGFDMTLTKTTVLIGKTIDRVEVQYQTANRVITSFTLPEGFYNQIWRVNKYVNGYEFDTCACIATIHNENDNALALYKNSTLRCVNVYYH